MNNSGLVTCPTCLERKVKNILGSVAPDGKIYIMRFGDRVTIVQSTSMMIICSCGFGTIVTSTTGQITYPII